MVGARIGNVVLPLTLAVVSLFALSAHAAQSARLVYGRGAGAERCPDEEGMRRAVASRLGYDPLVVASARTLVAELFSEGGTLKSRVYVIDRDGAAGGAREHTSSASDCAELAAAVALTVSIAIDPDAVDHAEITNDSAESARVEPEPEPEPPRIVASPPAVRPPLRAADDQPGVSLAHEKARPPVSLRWAFGASAFVASGPVPSPGLGAAALVALRGVHWGSMFEPRFMPASSKSAALANGVATARVSLYGATLAPCYRAGAWFACYALDGALLVSNGQGIRTPRQDRSSWFAHGPRLAHVWESAEDLSITLEADALLAAQRIALRVDDSDVFDTPRWTARLGLALDYEL